MNNHVKNYGRIINEIKDLHDKKNADYAGSEDSLANLRMCEKMGMTPFMGVVVRLSDKFCRLMRFCKTKELAVKDEGIKDTLKDIVNYAIFAIIFLEEEEDKKKLVGGTLSTTTREIDPALIDPGCDGVSYQVLEDAGLQC